jgi:hypothetical protein
VRTSVSSEVASCAGSNAAISGTPTAVLSGDHAVKLALSDQIYCMHAE